MFEYEIDQENKIVILSATGFMSISEVDDLNAQLLFYADEARRRFGVFRMLTDARTSSVQTAEVNARYKIPTLLMNAPADRYAVVLGSTLHKMQSERVLKDERAKAFLSMDEAKAWLLSN